MDSTNPKDIATKAKTIIMIFFILFVYVTIYIVIDHNHSRSYCDIGS